MKHIPTFESFINEAALNEYSTTHFNVPKIKDRLDQKIFDKMMPRTAKTVKDATKRIEGFNGSEMATHVQYFIVQPNGNKPDRPVYMIHNNQYYKWRPNEPKVNVTLLTINELKEGADWRFAKSADWTNLGQIYVDTDAYLSEMDVVFQTLKRAS